MKIISNIALASVRHHTEFRETAEITTTAWIDGGLITPDDVHLVIDPNKVKRAHEKLVRDLQEQFDKGIKNKDINNCFVF